MFLNHVDTYPIKIPELISVFCTSVNKYHHNQHQNIIMIIINIHIIYRNSSKGENLSH